MSNGWLVSHAKAFLRITYVVADLVHGKVFEQFELTQCSQSKEDVIKGTDLEGDTNDVSTEPNDNSERATGQTFLMATFCPSLLLTALTTMP
jgi:hypothetical protein